MESTPLSTSPTSDPARAHHTASPEAEQERGPGEDLVEIGRVVKPHGIRGEIVVDLWTDRTERLQAGSALWLEDRLVTVSAVRPHQGRFLVRIEEAGDRTQAERLRGAVLRAPPIGDPDAPWVYELVGATMVTTDGRTVGRVQAVEDNPASDLMVVDDGHLVPLTFARELSADQAGERRVVVDVPPGLLE